MALSMIHGFKLASMYSRVWAGKVGVCYKYREAGYGSVYVGFTCGVVILSGGDCTPRPPVYPASAGDGVQVWMCGRV